MWPLLSTYRYSAIFAVLGSVSSYFGHVYWNGSDLSSFRRVCFVVSLLSVASFLFTSAVISKAAPALEPEATVVELAPLSSPQTPSGAQPQEAGATASIRQSRAKSAVSPQAYADNAVDPGSDITRDVSTLRQFFSQVLLCSCVFIVSDIHAHLLCFRRCSDSGTSWFLLASNVSK